jgi:ABC-2 type transport system ATP-binding protein
MSATPETSRHPAPPAEREAAIVVRGVVKSFGDVRALDGVDLDVARGTVLGLLGPNGAGKTTLVRILTTLLTPDAGTATVVGYDVVRDAAALRHRIGLAGQYAAVDENLTGLENLTMVGRLYGAPRAAAKRRGSELLERFDLTDAGGRVTSTYSGGMRRRLDLAAALVAKPTVVFLDEPTTGLDPRSRLALWETIEGLVSEGTTVLLTTQYLDEADRLADRIAVLDQGHLVAQGTPGELKRQIPGSHVRLRFAGDPDVETAMRLLPGSARDDEDDLTVRVPGDGGAKSVRALLNQLDEHSIEVEDFSVHTPDLDDVFLALTGHASTEENAR